MECESSFHSSSMNKTDNKKAVEERPMWQDKAIEEGFGFGLVLWHCSLFNAKSFLYIN